MLPKLNVFLLEIDGKDQIDKKSEIKGLTYNVFR